MSRTIGFLRSKESAEEREKEKERKKDVGTQALMEQRCFNDFSKSIYKLRYKKFLMTMIKIRNQAYSNRYQGNKGLIIATRSENHPYLKKGDQDHAVFS